MIIPAKEFSIHFREDEIAELHRRIEGARLPRVSVRDDWSSGTDGNYLASLLDYWRDSYDWQRKERELNQYPQFTVELDDITIHFFHIRAARKGAKPLLLTHGWPDSFLRYAKAFPLLSKFDLVVPSLPGFAFSTLPPMGKVAVPTAIAAFPYDVLPVPREWIERNYPVIMYTEMPRGGHFTALEQPESYANNIALFMDKVFSDESGIRTN